MKIIKTQEAVGRVLCHDISQIIKGVTKSVVFKKGHVITEDDIPVLLSVGKDHIYIWENNDTLLHENDAAEILREICQGENMHATEPKEGKIELIADCDGILIVNVESLRAINSLGEMMIATRRAGFIVKVGNKVCGTRVIPLAIEKEKMKVARKAAGDKPILKIVPLKQKKYGIVTTGNEIFLGRIEDTFSPVIKEKLSEFGCRIVAHETVGDDPKVISNAIKKVLDEGAEMVFCTGGMSVDPDDCTPLAIKNTTEKLVTYGMPVLPGAMFLVSYTKDMRAVCGLPGGVMFSKRTVFDLILPRLLADVPITAEWVAGLGHGGLCLNCQECHFPNCSFGKGD